MINYVETLRAFCALKIYLLIIALIEVGVLLSIFASHPGHVHVMETNGKDEIPLSVVFAVCGFCTLIFATIAGSSAGSDRRITLNWTRPISRERLILSYMLVDVVAIFAAYAAVVVFLGFASLAIFGLLRYVELDADAPLVFATLFGASLMWYAMIQAVTAWFRGPAGAVSGVSWGVFITLAVVGASQHLPTALHVLLSAVNIFNPLSYASFSQFGDSSSTFASISTTGALLRMSAVYAFALSATFFALIGWKRSEL